MRLGSCAASRGLAVAAVMLGLLPGLANAASAKRTKPRASVPSASLSAPKPAAAPAPTNVPLLPGAGSKEPVSIDAAKLDYFDKDQKLVYTGDVVAVQGDSTMKASVLTIFLQKQDQGAQGGATAPAPATGGFGAPGGGSSVKHMEADGPVTLISKDQVGTGDHASYDKAENKVYMNGNVTLSQGTNVTQGDRLIYDLTNGQAQVFSGATNDRVKSVFTPGSGSAAAKPDEGSAAKTEPETATRKTSAGSKTAKTAKSGRATPRSSVDTTAEQ